MTTRRLIADPVAGIGYECLLCGGRAHAYSPDEGHTVEVWDLCRDCNDAFEDLADAIAPDSDAYLAEVDVTAVLAALRAGTAVTVSTLDLADVQRLANLTPAEDAAIQAELTRRLS